MQVIILAETYGQHLSIIDTSIFCGSFEQGLLLQNPRWQDLYSMEDLSCPLCIGEEKSVDHLFLSCAFTKALWFGNSA